MTLKKHLFNIDGYVVIDADSREEAMDIADEINETEIHPRVSLILYDPEEVEKLR